MADLKTFDKETVENIFVIIGMLPHYRGQCGTESFGKETIVIDDLLEAMDKIRTSK